MHSLQDTVNKKEINCDANLSSLFDGKTKILQTEVCKKKLNVSNFCAILP